MTNQTTFNWRQHLSVHPECAAVPELPRDELIALGNDIKTNGLRVPIVVNADGDPDNPEFKLLDGRSRLDAMALVGIEFTIERVRCEHNVTSLRLDAPDTPNSAPQHGNVRMTIGASEDQIGDLVLSLNAHRRHLTNEQKRELIVKAIKAKPEASNRQIAKQVKRSHPNVAKIRKQLEEKGDVEKVTTSIDTKGRKQPAKKTAKKVGAATKQHTIKPPVRPLSTDRGPTTKQLQEEVLRRNFANAVGSLMSLSSRPSAQFANVMPANDVAMVANFLNQIAATKPVTEDDAAASADAMKAKLAALDTKSVH